jgi:hypothetical protein
MRPFFKIPVAVHRILPTLDVSGAHPLALLSLFKRSSNAYQTLIKRLSNAPQTLFYRSAGLFVALLLSAPPIHPPRALIYRLSIAHLRGHRLAGSLPYSALTASAALFAVDRSSGHFLRLALAPALSWPDPLGSRPVGALPVGYGDRASRRVTGERAQPRVPVSSLPWRSV